MKTKIGIIISIITLIIMAYIGKEGYIGAKSYEQTISTISQHRDVSGVTEYKLGELANILTLGIVKNHKKELVDKLTIQKTEQKSHNDNLAIYFGLTAFVILLTYLLLSIRGFTIVVSLASIVALINGLITPIMLVLLHKDVEYLGDVVLSFESKSIIGSIEKLYTQGNLVLAGAILLFSILIPTVKSISLLIVSSFEYSPFASKMVRFFKHLGKWSMMDVFVVSLLLVYMTTGDSDISRAEIEIGLYMFLVYVILSIVASISADRMLRDTQP